MTPSILGLGEMGKASRSKNLLQITSLLHEGYIFIPNGTPTTYLNRDESRGYIRIIDIE
tara:strand:+ start:496 stop:672 length:177 start_codon:yes stop_codon:yes gene_type:complete